MTRNAFVASFTTALFVATAPIAGCASAKAEEKKDAPAAAPADAAKPAEGSCGGDKKAGEGSCGEGSCGADHKKADAPATPK